MLFWGRVHLYTNWRVHSFVNLHDSPESQAIAGVWRLVAIPREGAQSSGCWVGWGLDIWGPSTYGPMV